MIAGARKRSTESGLQAHPPSSVFFEPAGEVSGRGPINSIKNQARRNVECPVVRVVTLEDDERRQTFLD
jgi:hypothetical protein